MFMKSEFSLAVLFLAVLGLVGSSASSAMAVKESKNDSGEADAGGAVPATAPDAGPADDFGPPGPPQGDGQGRPGLRRPDGQSDGPDGNRPGPRLGRDGLLNRPDNFGFGQPPGDQPRGLRPDWPEMQRDDPEMSKLIKAENDLDLRTRNAARAYRDASKGQRAKLKEDLKKLVTEQFETRQQRRNLELARFEAELKRLREAANRREKDKQQLIEKRVSDLLGEEVEAGF
jgi:hypothetical protein